MRSAFCLSLVVLAGCHGEPPPAPATAPEAIAPKRPPLLIDGDLHGFAPHEELVRWASRLGDLADRTNALAELDALPPAHRVGVLRAGIRLRNATAARTCAELLEWRHLDDWEQGRVTRLLADAIVDPAYCAATGYAGNFGSIFESCSGEDLAYVLDLVAAHGDTLEDAGNLSILHKSASAEHLPQLARVALSTNADVRRHALDMILTTTIHTDQHREDVAAALLGITVEEARRRYPDAGDGLPPLLIAVLSLDEFPFDPHSKFRMWASRWLKDTHPAPRDVEYLLKLDDDDPDDQIAWLLRDVADPRIDPWLLATVSPPEPERVEGELRPPPPGPRSVRLGVLASRGDRNALAQLVANAEHGSRSLGVLLAVDPKAGRAVVERIVFGDDVPAELEMLRNVRDAWEVVPTWPGIEWDDSVFEGFADAALARKLDGVRLATIGVSVPRCRTRRLAAAAVAAMPRDSIPLAEDERRLELDSGEAAFLETAAPDAFRSLLRAWARSSDATTSKSAVRALARLGDPEIGALLVDAVRRGDVELEFLGRSPCPAVLDFLRERAASDFAAAVAYGHATGLPERVGLLRFCTYEDDPLAPEALEQVRSLLLAGRWKDAVAAALTAEPERIPVEEGLYAVGLVDDDRVRAYLQSYRERRELRLYPWATAELANMGDAAARAEYEHALRTGRYRWRDESDQIAFNDALRALPFWLDLLETNCCAFTTIRCNLVDHWFDFRFDTEGGGGASTPVAEARRFMARTGGKFVWSRLHGWDRGSYVPAPR